LLSATSLEVNAGVVRQPLDLSENELEELDAEFICGFGTLR
jgi:hypothetical protein